MKIPKFKRSRSFIHDLDARCLKATLRNSAVPELAARHRAKFADEPEFDIFLRAKDPAKITPWQRQMLERLFEKEELPFAIKEGMKEYEKQREAEGTGHDERAWADIKAHGVLAHVELMAVIIDDVKREVILSLSTASDGNLEEHGIAICLKKDRWRFNQADYLADYSGEVEDEENERSGADDEPDPFEEEERDTEDRKNEPETCSDAKFLYGTWVFDPETLTALRKSEGKTDRDIRSEILTFAGCRFEFAETRLRYWYKYSTTSRPEESEFLGCIRQGRKVTVKFRDLKGKRTESMVFLYENERLTNPHGGIYMRKTSG